MDFSLSCWFLKNATNILIVSSNCSVHCGQTDDSICTLCELLWVTNKFLLSNSPLWELNISQVVEFLLRNAIHSNPSFKKLYEMLLLSVSGKAKWYRVTSFGTGFVLCSSFRMQDHLICKKEGLSHSRPRCSGAITSRAVWWSRVTVTPPWSWLFSYSSTPLSVLLLLQHGDRPSFSFINLRMTPQTL